jgi:hypothetical protein
LLLNCWRLGLAVQSKFSRALTRKVGVLLLVVLEGELVGALDVLADAVEAEEKLRLADGASEVKIITVRFSNKIKSNTDPRYPCL